MSWEDNIPLAGRSPRKQSQSPRSTSLNLTKESHKIRKPLATAPPPPHRRPPVIIYDVTPEVIHTDPTQFKNVVQRLTSASSSTPSSSAFSISPFAGNMGTNIDNECAETRTGEFVSDPLHAASSCFSRPPFDPLPSASPSFSCPPSDALPSASPNFYCPPSYPYLIGYDPGQLTDTKNRNLSVIDSPDITSSPDTFTDLFDF